MGDRTRLLVDNVALANVSSFGVLTDAVSGLVRGTGLSVTGTGTGIGVQARTARLTDFTANGVYTALQTRVAVLDGADIASNAAYGSSAGRPGCETRR